MTSTMIHNKFCNRRSALWTILIALNCLSPLAFGKDGPIPVDRNIHKGYVPLPDPYTSPCPGTPRSLVQVSGNLYRHTLGSPAYYSGLVLITKEGAVVVDPARTCTAIALRDEIKERFHVPVKYVIYTHGHFDHIGGGQVFQQEGAVVIAQKNALEPIVGERLPTAIPDQVFDRRMTITIGGETVELHHVAPSHSNSMALIYFPNYKALQCTDICGSDSLPYNDFPDFYYDGWIESLSWIQTLDVDLVEDGHHVLANKKQQMALLDYMKDLHTQITALVRQGKPWDQVYREVKFKDAYKAWTDFGSKSLLNIAGMYRWVTTHRRGVW